MSKSKFWPTDRPKLYYLVRVTGVLVLTTLALRFYQHYRNIEVEPLTAWQRDPSADCGIALTGGSGRVQEGFALLSRGLIRKLIVSGVQAQAGMRDIMPHWTFYGKLDPRDIVLERRSTTTYGNAQQALPIVEYLACRDVVLITSRIHMFRAYQVFRANFPDSIPISKHSISSGKSEGFFDLSTEVLKSVFYSLWAY